MTRFNMKREVLRWGIQVEWTDGGKDLLTELPERVSQPIEDFLSGMGTPGNEKEEEKKIE